MHSNRKRDIRTIERDYRIHAKQFQKYAMQNGGILVPKVVDVKLGAPGSGIAGTKLVVDETEFSVGESVVITVGFTMEEYAGTLLSIDHVSYYFALGTALRPEPLSSICGMGDVRCERVDSLW